MPSNLYEQDTLVLKTLYDTLTVGETTEDMNNDILAGLAGLSMSKTRDFTKLLEHIGVIKREMYYAKKPGSMAANGRRYRWTILVDLAKATEMVNAILYANDNGRTKRLISAQQISIDPKRVTSSRARGNHHNAIAKDARLAGKLSGDLLEDVDNNREDEYVAPKQPASTAGFTNPDARAGRPILANDPAEVTRAIAGPDRGHGPFEVLRSMRKPTDAQALVEAAKQYRNRDNKMRTAIDLMVKTASDLGIVIDRESVEATAKYQVDPFMDAVSQVLPYIESIEAQAERQAQQIITQRQQLSNFDSLRNERNRLAKTNERLLAERVGLAAMRES